MSIRQHDFTIERRFRQSPAHLEGTDEREPGTGLLLDGLDALLASEVPA
jgi:hypothetical protein